MLEQLGYWGPVDVDLKFDRRDNSYKVLDVNPRIGSSFRLFSDQTGIDVVRTLYLDMTQQEIPAMSVPNGRKWFVEDDDFVSALQYRRDGRLSTKQWIESLRGIRESAYFCWDDSKPFVKVFLRFLLRSCNYLGKLFIREVRDILGRHPSAESQR
jgi:predicted ATP-grasp superfamily ATP-dependent carboligase